ncbi:metal ABC transporter substrate-binding protein [Pseudoflavonifractor sp. MSJ-37]|uniref:metal ABC transporter substrate-binding protein n=1 Tax=Pseudoflavonifractor sp. MSJ-37 TaxID=2841531 RepID=UPI003530283C
MKKTALAGLLAGAVLLSGCGAAGADEEQTPTVAATTWPVYCLASAVAEGVDGVEVVPVVHQSMSCLHDYTLTVADMKVLDRASLILENGVGLEDFMADAMEAARTPVVDCSQDVELRHMDEDEEGHDHEAEEHDHDHEGHDHGGYDPHIWMDPDRAALMADNIADALAEWDPDHAEAYQANAAAAGERLTAFAEAGREKLSGLTERELITFHDGFGYFAEAFDLHILRAIEEEEGSETSAKEFRELTALVREHGLPAVFTEVNGSDATARALAQETGISWYPLNMIMSGEGSGLEPYLTAMEQNIDTVLEALS